MPSLTGLAKERGALFEGRQRRRPESTELQWGFQCDKPIQEDALASQGCLSWTRYLIILLGRICSTTDDIYAPPLDLLPVPLNLRLVCMQAGVTKVAPSGRAVCRHEGVGGWIPCRRRISSLSLSWDMAPMPQFTRYACTYMHRPKKLVCPTLACHRKVTGLQPVAR